MPSIMPEKRRIPTMKVRLRKHFKGLEELEVISPPESPLSYVIWQFSISIMLFLD